MMKKINDWLQKRSEQKKKEEENVWQRMKTLGKIEKAAFEDKLPYKNFKKGNERLCSVLDAMSDEEFFKLSKEILLNNSHLKVETYALFNFYFKYRSYGLMGDSK